jgi:hypothetical protein
MTKSGVYEYFGYQLLVGDTKFKGAELSLAENRILILKLIAYDGEYSFPRDMLTGLFINARPYYCPSAAELSTLTLSCFFLYSLYMSSSQSLDLTAKLEITPDLLIGQYTETINYGCRLTDSPYHLIRIKVKIC